MRRFLTTILTAALLTACGDATGPEGAYVLRMVGNQELPVVLVQVLDNKLEITSGVLRINNDNTYDAAYDFRTTEGGTVENTTVAETGTYTVTDSSIQFTTSSGVFSGTFSGTISGNDLTIIIDGVTWVYSK